MVAEVKEGTYALMSEPKFVNEKGIVICMDMQVPTFGLLHIDADIMRGSEGS